MIEYVIPLWREGMNLGGLLGNDGWILVENSEYQNTFTPFRSLRYII